MSLLQLCLGFVSVWVGTVRGGWPGRPGRSWFAFAVFQIVFYLFLVYEFFVVVLVYCCEVGVGGRVLCFFFVLVPLPLGVLLWRVHPLYYKN